MNKYVVHLDHLDSAGKLNDEFVHAGIRGKKLHLRFEGSNNTELLSPGIRSSLILAKSSSLEIGSIEFYESNSSINFDKLTEILTGILAHCDTIEEISVTSDSDTPFKIEGSIEVFAKLIQESKNLTSFKLGVTQEKNIFENGLAIPRNSEYTSTTGNCYSLINALKNQRALKEAVINTNENYAAASSISLISTCPNLVSLVVPGAVLALEDVLVLGSACINQQNLKRLFYKYIIVDHDAFLYALGIDSSLKQFARKNLQSKTNIATESIKDKFWIQLAKSSIQFIQGFETKSDIYIENPIIDLDHEELKSILSSPKSERQKFIDPEDDLSSSTSLEDYKSSDVLVLW